MLGPPRGHYHFLLLYSQPECEILGAGKLSHLTWCSGSNPEAGTQYQFNMCLLINEKELNSKVQLLNKY